MVLIGCGLSLEGVAGVDQEGPPGEGGAEAWLEETTELLKRRKRTSLGVQWYWRSSDYDSGIPIQEVPCQLLVIELISCIPCSSGIKCQMQAPLLSKAVSCAVVGRLSDELCDTQREASVWE